MAHTMRSLLFPSLSLIVILNLFQNLLSAAETVILAIKIEDPELNSG